MKTYRYTSADNRTIQRSDGRFIPADPANRDYGDLVESGARIEPFVAPPPEKRLLNKTTLFRRMTDAEYTGRYKQIRSQQNERKAAIFDHAPFISMDDPDYPELRAAFELAFGAARAAELLAPDH